MGSATGTTRRMNRAGTAQTVLITGAAGGLGRALTSEFLHQGWRVAAGWHESKVIPVERTDSLWPLPMDVTNPTQVSTAVAEIVDRWGPIHTLIHNAGINLDQPLWRTIPSDWDRMLDVHLHGAKRCAQAVLPHMIQCRTGHIIHIGSFTARVGSRGQSAYATAKAALTGFTLALARETGPHNIRCNLVLPGVLLTPMTTGLAPAVLSALTEANALGRLNNPQEIARFIAFLTTTENISGQCFQLDSRIARWA
jgi:3-oxoacyl-[acyl-carrier protein] reductase